MTDIIRHFESVFWLCLIAFMFIFSTAAQREPIGIGRATMAIGCPLLLIAAGRSVIEIGQLSRQRFREGKASAGRFLALLTALASGGTVMLGLFTVDMIDHNLGRHDEGGLFTVDAGCVFRLTLVIGILLLFAAAGRSVVSGGQLSRQRFKEGRRSLGGVLALLTLLASGGMVMLGWVTVVFLLFALFYRQ